MIFNLIVSSRMNWLNKLRDVEDTSAGIYVKARADIAARDPKSCPFFAEGLLAIEFDADELDPDFVKELVDIGYAQVRPNGSKILLVLGEGGRWYTDPPSTEHPHHSFLASYTELCSRHGLPNHLTLEPKTFKLIQRVVQKEKHKEILAYAFANWEWLAKELNVSLPTINVLSSDFYWRRIVNHFERRTVRAGTIANRHVPEPAECFVPAKR